MMIRLMTWFIELQNRFNESRLFKISMIYILNWVNDLTSWQLIIELSFELTFWIQFNSKLNYLHFQFNLSWVEHIFNSMWFNLTRN